MGRLAQRLSVLMIVLPLILLACRSDKEPAPSNNASTQAPPTAFVQATAELPFAVDLILWHAFDGKEANGLQVLADYMAQEGEITLNLEYYSPESLLSDYQTAVRNGGGPDLLIIEQASLSQLADQGLITPLDRNLLSQFEDNLPANMFGNLFYEQQLWGMPLYADTLVLYTNTSLVPQAPQTFQDLVALETPLIIYSGTESTTGLYDSPTTSIVNEDGQPLFFLESMIDYLSNYQLLAQKSSVEFSDDINAFKEGTAGALIAYASAYEELHDALGDELLVSTLPYLGETSWKPLIKVSALFIGRNASDVTIQGAQLLFAHLTNPALQMDIATSASRTPAILNNADTLVDVHQVIWQQFQASRSWSPYPILTSEIFPALEQALAATQDTDADLVSIAGQFLSDIR